VWPHLVPETRTDEAEQLGELTVCELADRSISCSTETHTYKKFSHPKGGGASAMVS